MYFPRELTNCLINVVDESGWRMSVPWEFSKPGFDKLERLCKTYGKNRFFGSRRAEFVLRCRTFASVAARIGKVDIQIFR